MLYERLGIIGVWSSREQAGRKKPAREKTPEKGVDYIMATITGIPYFFMCIFSTPIFLSESTMGLDAITMNDSLLWLLFSGCYCQHMRITWVEEE